MATSPWSGMLNPALGMGKKSFSFHCPAEVSAVVKHVYLLFEWHTKSQKQVGLTYLLSHKSRQKDQDCQLCLFVVFPGEVCFIPDTRISFMCRISGRLLPLKWRQVARPKAEPTRYFFVFFLYRFLWNDSFTCRLLVFLSSLFLPHIHLLIKRGLVRVKY